MKRKYWCFFIGMCICSVLNASEMSGQLQSGRPINWNGVEHNAGEWSPAYWDIAMRLPPAQQLVPGGSESSSPRQVSLVNESGDSVNLSVAVAGIEYRLTHDGEVSGLGTGSSTTVQGNTAIVRGSGIGDTLIDFGEEVSTPFTHYRPILDFSGVNWTEAFKDKGSGEYKGSMSMTVMYDYYRDSIRVRHSLVVPLTLRVNYVANTVTHVHVTGTGEMQARYYGYPERLVSGETLYQVSIEGTIPNGVWIGLRNSSASDGRFYLTQFDGDIGATVIPYGVRCEGCTENSELINTSGEAQINMMNMRAKAEAAALNIRGSFVDAKLDDLANATYGGSFTLVFEAAL